MLLILLAIAPSLALLLLSSLLPLLVRVVAATTPLVSRTDPSAAFVNNSTAATGCRPSPLGDPDRRLSSDVLLLLEVGAELLMMNVRRDR